MKAKNITIGIKSVEEALNDFVMTGEASERGEKVTPLKGIYFTSRLPSKKPVPTGCKSHGTRLCGGASLTPPSHIS